MSTPAKCAHCRKPLIPPETVIDELADLTDAILRSDWAAVELAALMIAHRARDLALKQVFLGFDAKSRKRRAVLEELAKDPY